VTVYDQGTTVNNNRYFITNFDGDILTGIDEDYNLQWTSTALLQEYGRKAVTFRNPYQIPARIGQQLLPDHQIFKVKTPVADDTVFLEEVLGAEYIGAYKKYNSAMPVAAFISGRGYHPR
jgi:hypothetical protein